MDIGNGNIASVRLAAIFARIGTVVSEKILSHYYTARRRRFIIYAEKCEQIKMRQSVTAFISYPWRC